MTDEERLNDLEREVTILKLGVTQLIADYFALKLKVESAKNE